MSHEAADPNEYEWRQFLRGHRQELEDALLPTLAQAESAGLLQSEAARQLVQVRQVAESKGVKIEYPDGEPAPGPPMKMVTFYGKGGEQVQVPMPANPPSSGMRVRINGIDGVLYSEAGDEEPDSDEVDAAVAAALDVHARQVGHDGRTGIYGLAVTDVLRDELVDAWDNHYVDHGCQAAAMMLDRIIEQLIVAFRTAQG